MQAALWRVQLLTFPLWLHVHRSASEIANSDQGKWQGRFTREELYLPCIACLQHLTHTEVMRLGWGGNTVIPETFPQSPWLGSCSLQGDGYGTACDVGPESVECCLPS